MSDELRNSTQVVEQRSAAIRNRTEEIEEINNTGNGITNLTVIEKMQYIIDHINKSVKDYKELSYDDVEAILGVHKVLNNTDENAKKNMQQFGDK